MTSKALTDFLASTSAGGSRAALDRYDYDAWLELSEAERAIGLDAVVERLRQRENDPRAVKFLLDFNVAGATTDELIPILGRYPSNETKAWLCLYLWEMDVEQAHLEVLVAMAKRAPDPDIRSLATGLLARTTYRLEPTFIPEALIALSTDEDEDVRFAVHQAVYKRYEGFETAERVAPSAYAVIARLLLSDLPTVHVEGARLLGWAVRRAAKGAPVMTGSPGDDAARVRRFQSSWQDRSGDIDVEAAVGLTGMARWWATYCLLGSIHDDARASACLAAMNAVCAVPALREQVEEGYGDEAEAAEAAVQALDSAGAADVLAPLRETAADDFTPPHAAEVARAVVAAGPEWLFDAAIDLSPHTDVSRIAFRDALADAAPEWFKQHGAHLNGMLDLG
jgi:hypothetical protein